MKLEVCVDSLESAVIASQCGAHRIELCENLDVGGLTPSADLVRSIKQIVGIPVFVMIRPRPGNFLYSIDEQKKILTDIKIMPDMKVDGLVFGALNKDNYIDVAFCKEFMEASSGLPVTFHRAFDVIKRKQEAIEDVINLGFSRVLTTGGPETAEEGIQELKELISKVKSRIIVMPGGGVNDKNIEKIAEKTDAREIHSSARTKDKAITSKVCSVKMVQLMRKAVDSAYRRRMLKIAAM